MTTANDRMFFDAIVSAVPHNMTATTSSNSVSPTLSVVSGSGSENTHYIDISNKFTTNTTSSASVRST